MSKDTLADILSGAGPDPVKADLRAALDELLNAADKDGGRLDAPAFWGFVAALAEGRGIADELEAAAASMVASKRPDKGVDSLTDTFKATQVATLFHLLGRLSAFGGAILPESFSPVALRAIALNLVDPGPGIHPDLLGLGSTRGGEGAMRRAARRQLVMAVYYRAARDGLSLADARDKVFPADGRGLGFHRTWQGWQREVAEAKDVDIREIGADAEAAARGVTGEDLYDLDAKTTADLFKFGWLPS